MAILPAQSFTAVGGTNYAVAPCSDTSIVNFSLQGTFTGTSVVFEASEDGGVTFPFPIAVFNNGSNALASGTIALSDTVSIGYHTQVFGYNAIRCRPTAIGGGTLTVTPAVIPTQFAVLGGLQVTALSGNQNVTGTGVFTATSANALAAGQTGTTSPVFNVNTNTANAVTGITIVGAAAAAGVAVQVTSTGTNEALTIDAKAAALVTIGGAASTALGLQVGSSTSAANATLIVYSSNAAAMTVGPNGATNPALTVVASTASAKTGLSITGAAAGSGVALASTSNATNEALTLDGKGSGIITIGSVSTGGCNVRVAVQTVAASGTAIGNAAAVVEGYTYVTGSNNSAAVKLPAGAIGMQVTLQNTVQTATLQVFPQVNNAISNLANNAVYNIGNGGRRTFTYVTAGQWYTDPSTIV
jgi:hypothetical protein